MKRDTTYRIRRAIGDNIGCAEVAALSLTAIFAVARALGAIVWQAVWILAPLWIYLTILIVVSALLWISD